VSTVGDNILYMRKRLGWTQEELANKMGYKSKSTINKIELGINDIPQSKIVKFAEVLNTTPAFLMGWEDEDENTLEQTELSEGERIWLQLYNKLSERTREAFITMADAFDRLPEEVCEFYLASLQGVLANQKTKQEQ
jgi:transcriptional regulator with XRE-family HTH domain